MTSDAAVMELANQWISWDKVCLRERELNQFSHEPKPLCEANWHSHCKGITAQWNIQCQYA